jgi:type IV pilus assembly protein PilP
MELLMLQRVGIRAYTAGRAVLLTGLIVGIATVVMATNPEPRLLAMSLFSQEAPLPPIAKPKPAPAKPPGAVGNVVPSAVPQPPGSVTAPPIPSAVPQPQPPGSVTAPPIAAVPSPTAPAKPVPELTGIAPSPAAAGTTPLPALPAPAGRPLAGTTLVAGLPISLTDGYSYDPKSRRDPFQSMVKLLKLSQTKAELPPLQRLELSDVKLVGIVSDASGYYGLIQTPDGKGYTVRVGTPMGTNNGTIRTISEQRIVVAEPAIDTTGKMTSRDVEILQRPKEGAE